MNNDRGPSLAIIVCSYNGARRLGTCLDALNAQEHRDCIEIVCVDDGSTDDTTPVAQSRGVRVVTLSSNAGLSAARNAGIRATSAPIVAFTDDDCIPGPDWARRLLDAWSQVDDTVMGIGGEVDCHHTDTYARRFLKAKVPLAPLEFETSGAAPLAQRLRRYFVTQPKRKKTLRAVRSLVGASMSFRRTALEAIGGFDEAIRFGGDEEYVCNALGERYGHGCLLVDPGLVMPHEFEPDLRDSLRRANSYGKGIGRDWVRHGGIPAARPGVVLVALAVSAALVLGGRRAALVAALCVPALVWRELLRGRSLEAATFPYVELAHEFVANVGILTGAARTYVRRSWAD